MKSLSLHFTFALLAFPSLLAALTFNEWRTATFTSAQLSASAVSSATVDPDGDGMANLHEYAFFGQPLAAESSIAPVFSQAEGHLLLTHRERHGMSDVSIRLQGSDTLSNWITYNTVTEADREAFADYDEVTLIDPLPLSQPRRFLRLRVELLPVTEPREPTQLGISVSTANAWNVSWTDPNTTEVGYAIERWNPSSYGWDRLKVMSHDTGAWQQTDANYQLGTSYRVAALGNDGTEKASAAIALADQDEDGIPDLLEKGSTASGGYYATLANDADTDGDEIPDGWEIQYGLDPLTMDSPQADLDGDGISNLQEYLNQTDPRDYYNGSSPVITILGGSQQSGVANSSLSSPVRFKVTTATGVALPSAPIDITVTEGGGKVAAQANGAASKSMVLRTDSNGEAEAYWELGSPTDVPSNQSLGVQAEGTPQSFTNVGALNTSIDPDFAPVKPVNLYYAVLPVGSGLVPIDINNKAQIVCSKLSGEGDEELWLWKAGAATQLLPGLTSGGDLVNAEESFAFINNSGDVLFSGLDATQPDYWPTVLCFRSAQSNTNQKISLPRLVNAPSELKWFALSDTNAYAGIQAETGYFDDGSGNYNAYWFSEGLKWNDLGFDSYAKLGTARVQLSKQHGTVFNVWSSYGRAVIPEIVSASGDYAGIAIEPKLLHLSPTGPGDVNSLLYAGNPNISPQVNGVRVSFTPVAINSDGFLLGNKNAAPAHTSLVYAVSDRKVLHSVPGFFPIGINKPKDILALSTQSWAPQILKYVEETDDRDANYEKALIKITGYSVESLKRLTDEGMLIGRVTKETETSSQGALLMPLNLESEDRLVKGSIVIPENWANVTLSFRSTETNGQNLGTFAALEPGVSESSTYIYNSEDDILSEEELTATQSGTVDPRANTQAVVFYRDADNPRRLHFTTAFDQVGEIEIALSFGPESARITGQVKYALTAQTDTADLIATLDQRIESMVIPEVVDFDLDTDGDGVPDGGTSDLITASQPGTMAAPGAFVSEAGEDNPINLVLLVNSDDDNADSVADSLNTSLDAADNDLARVVLRAPSGLSLPLGTLTLTHNGGPALRLRFATGPPIASGTSVNLASPSGVLAGLATGPLTLYAEGLAPASDVAIVLSYTPLGESTPSATDTVRLTVIDPATLASIQVQHRYFALAGDLGGLVSRTYAANGAYRQLRVGLSPIGANAPLQNRNLLAKSLFVMIGSLKTTAAYYRGTADGFWLGLKGDWEGLQDAGTAAGSAIAFLFVEDDAGRMARAVAVYEQFREIKKAFDGIGVRQIPGIIGQMASTITRDLYTDAEAALGWEPVTPGLDIQVISYMSGITTGYVGEQIVVGVASGAAAVRITAKIAPMIRGVIAAVKDGTRLSLEALDDSATAAAWFARGSQKSARSQGEAKVMLQAVQKIKKFEFPDGFTVPKVINDWFKVKPELFNEVLTIWTNKFPANVSGERVAHMMNDLGSVLHRNGTAIDFPDDAVKGFAHLQAKLFKTGDDSISRWKDCEKLFGDLDTLEKRDALKDTLIQLNSNVSSGSVNTWVKVSTQIKNLYPQMYHYIDADQFRFFDVIGVGVYQKRSNPAGTTYISPDVFVDSIQAKTKLQIPNKPGVQEIDRARYRCRFSTDETSADIRIPAGYDLNENTQLEVIEAVTRDNPQFGVGGGRQFTTSLRLVIDEVWDIKENRILTDQEVFNLINQFN